ncbi:hypothetical protein ILUMI_02641 [Ignelater luminosus]|uniref:Uncharacterized protein n=1 Tax=Ignelater luminosus TaxID=2038154 RepID=A0A8K0GN07_IGNLU|nr:hypothetical protein ILUMI_02641 [Ignelater luminosus]
MGHYEAAGVEKIPKYGARRRRKRYAGKRKKGSRRKKLNVSATTTYSKLAKPSRDPFVQFLQRCKQKHRDWTITKIAVEGTRNGAL